MKKGLIMAVMAGLIYIGCGSAILFADGGDELPPPRPLPKYSNAVKAVETDDNHYLTKDSLSAVKKFFETKTETGDRIEPLASDGKQAFKMSFYKKIGGQERSVQLVEAEEKTPDNNAHPALGELKSQVMMGKHSEAEFQVLEKKYKNLHRAYFRQVSDDKGGTVSEGEKIYRKAFNQAHGKEKASAQANAPDAEETAAGKAEAQDIKKKMQELKAKGDVAGMMALAQGSNKLPGQTKQGAAAMDAMNKDTWDIWVKCLEDIDKVAYWTKVQYTATPQ